MVFWNRFDVVEEEDDVNGNWAVGLTLTLFVTGDNGDGGGVDSAN